MRYNSSQPYAECNVGESNRVVGGRRSLFNLMEKPLLRRALGDGHKSIVFMSGLASEPDAGVFDGDALEVRERHFPLESKLVH
jgi:hypothetical protein